MRRRLLTIITLVATIILTASCSFVGAVRSETFATSGFPTDETQTVRPQATRTPAPSLPTDVTRLGEIRPASEDEAIGAISAVQAITAATDRGYSWPNPDAYLVVATRPSTGSLIHERLVWLVRWDNVNVDFSRPWTGNDQTMAPPSPYRFAYVFVDARSNEVLVASYSD